ncbi:hypothetical protein CR513_31390, partial [Mucuna pruriens]
MFRKVEINIPLLDAIKHIPKYIKFLKELCMHKRKKMKGGVEVGGIVSVLTRNKEFTTGAQQALPKKCQDPKIFSIPCIGNCTFVDAMLDLGASINVMPTSIYKSLNFEDLEPTGMTIQLAKRSVIQPLGVLEDVLVQVNELIFPANFYVLDKLVFSHLNVHQITKANYSIVNPRSIFLKDTVRSISIDSSRQLSRYGLGKDLSDLVSAKYRIDATKMDYLCLRLVKQ